MKNKIFLAILMLLFLFSSCNHSFNLSESEWQDVYGQEKDDDDDETDGGSEAGTFYYPQYVYSHWKMDEGVTPGAIDELGNINLSTSAGYSINSTLGKIGNCRGNFLNPRDFFSTTNFPHTGDRDFAFEGWIKLSNNDGTGIPIIICDNFSFTVANNQLNYKGTDIMGVEADRWYYFFIYYNSSNSDNRVYIDNVLVFTRSGEQSALGNTLCIGGTPISNFNLNGSIDDVAYWSDVPSDITELETIISQRWNNGNGKEYVASTQGE